jgi:hypothetical protein
MFTTKLGEVYLGRHPIQWVPGALTPGEERLGSEADHSPPSSAEVKNAWYYTSTPQYVLKSWCLIKQETVLMELCLVKHRDNSASHGGVRPRNDSYNSFIRQVTVRSDRWSWEADYRSGGRESPFPLWNPKVHYYFHKSPSLDITSSQMHPLHDLTSSLRSTFLFSSCACIGL